VLLPCLLIFLVGGEQGTEQWSKNGMCGEVTGHWEGSTDY